MRVLLTDGGRFVFAVDTVACRCPDDADFKPSLAVKTKEGFDLIAKYKNTYDEATHTQYSPLFTSCTTGIRFCKASPWTSRSTCTSWAKWKRSSLSSDSAKSKCIRRTISSRPPQMKRKCSFCVR